MDKQASQDYRTDYSDQVSLSFTLLSYFAAVFCVGLAMGFAMSFTLLFTQQMAMPVINKFLLSIVFLPLSALHYFFFIFIPVAIVYFPLYALLYWRKKLSMQWLCLSGAVIGAIVGSVSSVGQTTVSLLPMSLSLAFCGAAGCYGAYWSIRWRAKFAQTKPR